MVKTAWQKNRQRVRKGLLYLSLLLFPITMSYLSPYVIVDGAASGILNASAITFALMFLGSIFLGRLWCGWVCPAGALQDGCIPIQNKPVNKKLNWIKWAIWVPWLALIVFFVISGGGYKTVDLFHRMENGVSVFAPGMYIIYYIVIGTFVILSLTVGKRAGCHTLCWMAPFMILGRKLGNLLRAPALRLKVEEEKCINCKRCTKACPMSLDVNQMVQAGTMENSACTLCGSCVDVCPKDVIHYTFGPEKRVGIQTPVQPDRPVVTR